MEKYDIAIIGGGVIGASIAYELSRYNLKIIVFEKNPYLGEETSQGNSGVIHGGFDPTPGKINARLNVIGNKLWQTNIFPYLTFPRQQIDSLVVAFDSVELDEIKKLYQRGLINGVKAQDMQILSKQALLKRSPHLNPKAQGALLCTSSWTIDPNKATLALFGASVQNQVEIKRNSEVTDIQDNKQNFTITIKNQPKITANYIINAAGHYADIIAQNAKQSQFNLVARRGEYRILSRSQAHLVKDIYFMVPTIHGKGVIVAPMLDGKVLVGPTAEENIPKQNTRLISPKMYSLIDKIGHKLIPDLDMTQTETSWSGSRPIEPTTDDFVIEYGINQHFISVAGTKSPGLSSAPAIALEIKKMLEDSGLKLTNKKQFNPKFNLIY